MYNNSNKDATTEGQKILAKLKEHHGSLSELANRLDMTRDYVRRVLQGEVTENADVVLKGAELVLELESARAQKIERARAILDQVYNITL